MKINQIVTHNGTFHSDEVFGCAVLAIYFDEKKEFFNITRTRDENIINQADIVLDVGGIYDEDALRFDHHQKGGAGLHENGAPYASFGLIWKRFGEEVCGNAEIAEKIEKKLVTPIDCADNGFAISMPLYDDKMEYFFGNFIRNLNPTWKEKLLIENVSDEYFSTAMEIAKTVIKREIRNTRDFLESQSELEKVYENSEDNRFVILETNLPWKPFYFDFSELLYIIYPGTNGWKIEANGTKGESFKQKKPLPKAWAGLKDEELQKITGVSDALFCHNALFLASAESKEGIMELLKLALENNEE